MDQAKSIVITAGGTGGHIFPALSVWEVVVSRHPKIHVTWIGSSQRMESKLIPSRGIDFTGFRLTGFRRSLSAGNIGYNLRSLWYLVGAVTQSIGLLRNLKPKVVLTTGGFAGGPVGIAAWLTGTPLAVMEPNAYPGMTNRFLGKKAAKVFVAYVQAKAHFPSGKTHIIGTPARREVAEADRNESRRKLNISDDTLFILALGGSQGAAGINKVLPEAVKLACKERPDLKLMVVHQCGQGKMGSVTVDRSAIGEDRYKIVEFIEDTPSYLAAADVVVTRSGASTLSEIAVRGLPSVLIPFPFSSDDHQVKNARSWEQSGAAFCIEEKDLTAPALATQLLLLLTDSGRRETMGSEARRFGDAKAGEKIVDLLESYLMK